MVLPLGSFEQLWGWGLEADWGQEAGCFPRLEAAKELFPMPSRLGCVPMWFPRSPGLVHGGACSEQRDGVQACGNVG